ncbi:hypothetical protein DENSPDRAFT_833528 [Dentipellis sp. KUC8613]|nr:hypothetical protein DENSPDRAFT_833528 [Dentipellis sp. KUC8613]
MNLISWCSPLSHERAQALNPTAVAAWYDLVKEWCVDKDIPPELIYGMDKSRFPLGGFSKQMVVGRKGTKRQHKQGGGDRENITVIATICADGTRLDPTIIFKGKNFFNVSCPQRSGGLLVFQLAVRGGRTPSLQ